MLRIAAAVVFFQVSATIAQADVDLVKVPVPCGPTAEMYGLLQRNMPEMSNIGAGSDQRGQDVAVLFVGPEHWALIATVSADQICVVASGRTWTTTQAAPVAQY